MRPLRVTGGLGGGLPGQGEAAGPSLRSCRVAASDVAGARPPARGTNAWIQEMELPG